MPEEKTHFGYQEIPSSEKTAKVAEVFHSVAKKYDLMNDLMSFGIHRIWKRLTLTLSQLKPGDKVLDVAGGTGDMTRLFLKKVGSEGEVVLSDINPSMLKEGRKRLLDLGIVHSVKYVLADAEQLPFPEGYFNVVCIAFGLRNITDKQKALASLYRVLKPGGQLLILEFSKTNVSGLKQLYDLYSFKLLPKLGKLVAKDEESYRYLAESIRMHPDQNTLKNMMETVGFVECNFHNFTGGITALHKGIKP